MVDKKTVLEKEKDKDKEFQTVLKELGLENKKLTEQDFSRIYGYMQETFWLG